MKSSSASVLSQLSKLVLGSACFIVAVSVASSAMNSAKTAFFADSVAISPQIISWTKIISPEFKPQEALSTKDLIMGSSSDRDHAAISTQVARGLRRISKLEKAAKQRHHYFVGHHVRDQATHRALVAAQAPIQQRITADRVPISQSEVMPAAVFVEQPKTEAEKLQGVQASLVSRFMIAMNSDLTKTTQVAEVSTQSAAILLQHAQKNLSVIEGAPVLKKAVAHQAHKPIEQAIVATRAPSKPAQAQNQPLFAVAPVKVSQAAPQFQVKHDPPVLFKLAALDTHQTMSTQIPRQASPQQASHDQTLTTSFVPPPVPMVLANLPPSPLSGTPPAVSPTQKSASVEQMAEEARKLWTGYSPAKTEPPAAKLVSDIQTSVNTPEVKKVSTPLVKPLARPLPQAVPPVADAISSSSSVAVAAPAIAPVVRSGFAPLQDDSTRWIFHEAFDWTSPVAGTKVEILSNESSTRISHRTLGWRLAHASLHWTTLFWGSSAQGEEIPMLNAIQAKMLATKAATALQNDAGIVLAKVPAGWTLEFSGRSEHPLIFDRQSHSVSSSAVDGERYYVFLNASPGEQLLYLNHAGGETGALAVPVLGGVMMYADLTQAQKKSVSGRVLETGEGTPHGIAGVHVQVIGSNASTVTGPKGAFKIDNVLSFGDQSLYLETETQKGFPHRYKISPSQLTELTLFQIIEDQVHDWIGQLEGGVSSESGLIVGALPTLAAAQEQGKPLVEVRSLAVNPTLTPETYTLSNSGQLLVKTPISGDQSRFMSVQVPEGPALIQVVDKDGRLIWSEITVISPRVLTLVGPY